MSGGEQMKWPPYWAKPTGEEVSLLDDAQALQEAAEHVEMVGLPGAASVMRRCAARLYQFADAAGTAGSE